MDLTLLVLAAGLGSRFGGLKQLEPLGPQGETLLDYSVHDARRAGFTRVVFVVREEFAAAFDTGIAARYRGALRVHCVCQRLDDLPDGLRSPAGRSKPWGTAHAVLAARALLDAPFAVVNADDFYGRQAYRAVAQFFAEPAPADGRDRCCMVGYPIALTLSDSGGVNRGLCVVHGDRLAAVQEVRDIRADASGRCSGVDLRGQRVAVAGNALVSMNCWGFTPAVVEPMQRHLADFVHMQGDDPSAECYIPSVVDALIRDGRTDCTVLRTVDRWFGITYPQDKADCVQRLAELARLGVYPAPLWP